MAGNTFGNLFKITTFGESHGGAVGVVIDGCPAGFKISEKDIQKELDRRKPGQSKITTQRNENDEIKIYSGVFEGKTIGSPIMIMVKNKDAKSDDYSDFKDIFRPSHADYTYEKKYGIRNWAGGGRSSARETLARVAAGAVAKKYLKEMLGIEILSYVEEIGEIMIDVDERNVKLKDVEANIVRCPDQKIAKEMIDFVSEIAKKGDSVGGVIRCVIRGCPVGLGDPVFDRLEADLAKAMLSINASKGFEIGSGFAGSMMKGSDHNDEFYVDENGNVRTKTNMAGGVLGGISSGEDIDFRVAFKPVATILKTQKSVDKEGNEVDLRARGRHDPCVVPRAVPIVDAMSALVLMDHYLRNKGVK